MVFDIVHSSQWTFTIIRGYMGLGGMPHDPRAETQDRAWFGPHDRLFTEEESEPLGFVGELRMVSFYFFVDIVGCTRLWRPLRPIYARFWTYLLTFRLFWHHFLEACPSPFYSYRCIFPACLIFGSAR